MKTIVHVRTRVTVEHGAVSCDASPESDELSLTMSGKDGWTLRVKADQVLAVIEALGGAYDWRKRKIAEHHVGTAAAPGA